MKNSFDLRGRNAVVTGASKGLGFTFARALANAGARVLIAARGRDRLEQSAEALRNETGAEIIARTCDISNRDQAQNLAAQALAALGNVDIFVGNAASAHQTFVETTTGDDIDKLFELNFVANVLMTAAFSAGMKARGWGRIVYLSSIAGHASSADGHALYAATKSALEAFARTAAIEFGPHGVTVNCIAPGVFLTDLPKERFDTMPSEVAEKIYNSFADMTALGRWGDPEELTGALLLLASDAGAYITGTVLHVDGGMAIRSRPRDR